MKLSGHIAWALLFLATSSFGQMHLPGNGALDLIIDSVDAETAAELTASRDNIADLRDQLTLLRDAEDADQDAIDALRAELRDARSALREQIRTIVQDSEELQAELRSLAQETREDMVAGRYVLRNDEVFDQVVAAASAEQAEALTANQTALEALKDELQAAKDAGATRDDVSELIAEIRVLRDAQRDLVNDVLDANDELLSGIIEDASAARDEAREGFRDRRFRRPRPNG